ncbi:SDR family oxidoreductase [Nanchangia anserum]|uniref:SDR family oxidoreductase n=1 Tax=Nanchangia anserum TaxID=2692125 RepID=A0A8I0KPA8_9ACTO|nr:SDR family oxidoreductase [Nanchangia anserum]MBD3688700.1 SDR family oxidoreductase [Nanchangia anserum]QOX82447.1 SDR family oxidoreductase [Nanchangia anserum]
MRHALITGATRGIGRAIAEALSPTYHLYIGGTAASSCEKVAAAYPHATPWPVNLTDLDAVTEAAAAIDELDVLIHSAGIAPLGNVANTTSDHWREVFEVNVFAPVHLTQALLPALRRSHGQVLTLNSGAGFHSMPGGAAYAASKFALRAFTDALREEEREHIRVISIHPGRVDTDMQVAMQNAGPDYDGTRYVDPASVAQACAFALSIGEDATVESLEIRPRFTH